MGDSPLHGPCGEDGRNPEAYRNFAERMGILSTRQTVGGESGGPRICECAKKGWFTQQNIGEAYEKHKVILVVSINGDTPKIDDLYILLYFIYNSSWKSHQH